MEEEQEGRGEEGGEGVKEEGGLVTPDKRRKEQGQGQPGEVPKQSDDGCPLRYVGVFLN